MTAAEFNEMQHLRGRILHLREALARIALGPLPPPNTPTAKSKLAREWRKACFDAMTTARKALEEVDGIHQSDNARLDTALAEAAVYRCDFPEHGATMREQRIEIERLTAANSRLSSYVADMAKSGTAGANLMEKALEALEA